MKDQVIDAIGGAKFRDPLLTANGDERASVSLRDPQTLWFNTGTLCNITCRNCYIDSSPTNDALAYLSAADVADYLAQLKERNWGVREIGFTGGEPFMNPAMCDMARLALVDGYDVLILTNAMAPMMRKSVRQELLALNDDFPGKLTMRVSADHWSAAYHDEERGLGSFAKTLMGMKWLRDHNFNLAVAARTVWGETEVQAREGFAALFAEHGFDIDAADPGQTVLFPEMDQNDDVPEITTECWSILGKDPGDVMCASSRMVVRRKGADKPAVLACTLLPYAPEFEMGETLAEAEADVRLNHRHCSRFCVLGGASCSA